MRGAFPDAIEDLVDRSHVVHGHSEHVPRCQREVVVRVDEERSKDPVLREDGGGVAAPGAVQCIDAVGIRGDCHDPAVAHGDCRPAGVGASFDDEFGWGVHGVSNS
ncbi:hypothetical protein [Curtobacterium sp. VKM Ac-1395]|uniref:hypothetical protein n=1 Tax=Curtobacterium sp. VKM Ac-1395 TaxID=2783815 RepID=UPI002B27BD1F|nr:hypothetical protein [Curtobacterium sp. VKM Ac-1395]